VLQVEARRSDFRVRAFMNGCVTKSAECVLASYQSGASLKVMRTARDGVWVKVHGRHCKIIHNTIANNNNAIITTDTWPNTRVSELFFWLEVKTQLPAIFYVDDRVRLEKALQE
jgi:hypothetical protein